MDNVKKQHPTKVVIIGASGHGRVIADIVRRSGDDVLGFLDDRSSDCFQGLTILGKTSDAQQLADKGVQFIIGIGSNETRKRVAKELSGIDFYTAIHPSAVIAEDVSVGAGTVIMPNAVVNTGCRIGRHCIINTASTVDHDDTVCDYVHLSPGVHLSGSVIVGEGTWLCTGAVVSNNLNICNGCIVGAGSVVIRDIGIPGTYYGVPAKWIPK